MEKFELATRKKYRYPYRGLISTEDLWDLNLTQLDGIYSLLSKEAKAEQSEESLLTEKVSDQDLLIKIEIVKHVFHVKKEEQQAAHDAVEKAKKKERLLEILAKKQDDNLSEKSEDELKKMIEELG